MISPSAIANDRKLTAQECKALRAIVFEDGVAFMVKKAPAGGVGGTGLSGRPELVKLGQSPAGRYFTKHITHHEHYRSTAGRAVAVATKTRRG
jgi:hypothetical protein